MERPTCGTCPYWDDTIDEEYHVFGECRRFPPKAPSTHEQQQESDNCGGESEGFFRGWYVITGSFEWCGEHPRFKDYLAALEAEREASMPSRP